MTQDHSNLWTYGKLQALEGEDRWELIYGVPYLMASPCPRHQRISKLLTRHLDDFLAGKPCEAYQAIDVRLFPQESGDDDIVPIPDISVVCDPSQVDQHACNGAPTLVIEILSPSTAGRDFGDKKDCYKKAGVQEYWIVDPFNNEVQRFLWLGRQEKRMTFRRGETLVSPTFPGLELPLLGIFPAEP
ncbi:MAG: Uma2 family endonuclease [Oscillospiraceae bacterium]|nr:Uma2 family endonuclease [Oscillospiraceae bacterium]